MPRFGEGQTNRGVREGQIKGWHSLPVCPLYIIGETFNLAG